MKKAVRQHSAKNRKTGFTIIELLVVMAIIVALAGILVPVFAKARIYARKIKCQANLNQVNLAVNMYVSSNDGCYPCERDPVSTNPAVWLWMGRGWKPFISPYLGDNISPDNPSVLLCPSNKTDKYNYGATSYSYSMTCYHSPKQIDSIDSIAWQYKGNLVMSSVPQKLVNVSFPAYKIIIGEWLSNHLKVDSDAGWWCENGQRNFLFADGHIGFIAAESIKKANDSNPNPNVTVHGINGVDTFEISQ